MDKFCQVGRVDGERPTGSGLGLTIARHLVELHGGRIWVEAAECTGSRFVVLLPAACGLPGSERARVGVMDGDSEATALGRGPGSWGVTASTDPDTAGSAPVVEAAAAPVTEARGASVADDESGVHEKPVTRPESVANEESVTRGASVARQESVTLGEAATRGRCP